MKPVRFVMIGGFLGAGKTTTIGRLAKMYMAMGRKVGIVTNDQAQDLVDTNNLRAQGLSVQEVPGACFCCKFNELVARAGQLKAEETPDIIIAEPVGSCTDLVSTVVLPLKDLHKGNFVVAPYPVIFKPSHGLRILRNQSAGFSPKAAYIFRKQLEEADAILMNRIDELTPELGWLNSTFRITAEREFDLDGIMTSLINLIAADLASRQAEVAHLKLIGLDNGGGFAVANVVSSSGPGELSVASKLKINELNLIVNARVATDPEELDQLVRKIIVGECDRMGLRAATENTQVLRPGRPTPTHRYPATV